MTQSNPNPANSNPGAARPSEPQNGIELSVVLPTYKERGNVAELVKRLALALEGIRWEAIFVDDNSPDGTSDAVKAIAMHDSRVRCLRRVGRRGLAGACIEGMLSSSADFVAVMDADLQHDETILPAMVEKLRSGNFDLVAGTRYVGGGSAAVFSDQRGKISRLATKLAQRILGTSLSDPMSGFFMMRRDTLDAIASRLSPVGFKILLDIATAGKDLRVAEEAYSFRARFDGASKFNAQIGLEFLGLLLSKFTHGLVDPRFIFFALVGAIGIVVNVAVFYVLLFHLSDTFLVAKSVATFVSMVSNFLLNNSLTYRDKRLRGWHRLSGFVGFCLIGAVGALTDIGLASRLYATDHQVWWVAATAGAFMCVLWNYAMSSMFIWRTR